MQYAVGHQLDGGREEVTCASARLTVVVQAFRPALETHTTLLWLEFPLPRKAAICKSPDRPIQLRNRENHQLIRRHNRDVLLAVLRLIRHRVRVASAVELRGPQFLSGLRIKRAEAAIVRRADED